MRVYLLRRVLPLPKKYTLFPFPKPNLHKRSYATEAYIALVRNEELVMREQIATNRAGGYGGLLVSVEGQKVPGL
jgi:hypothetical protein